MDVGHVSTVILSGAILEKTEEINNLTFFLYPHTVVRKFGQSGYLVWDFTQWAKIPEGSQTIHCSAGPVKEGFRNQFLVID